MSPDLKECSTHLEFPRLLGVKDNVWSRTVEGLEKKEDIWRKSEIVEKKTTCQSSTTGLLCLQAYSTSAPITRVTRQSLVRTLGPGLVIMNTAGRGEELLLGLQLEEDQELEQRGLC